ncbi:MAG: hypothetical protein H7641_01280 [Candidatus Heimdallarchaeota archaeon]|nr:hypothetical protein [Candidatus Heimdallarchaeota archaeon]MCK4876198.1 hypothetical protein [Candidatus Heimdallarchaeota archaeon]
MSTVSEERYVDLRKLCDKVDSELFDPLSWILILNLDLIPVDDIMANENMKFSYYLMHQRNKEASDIAKVIAALKNPISKHYNMLLKLDPDLSKTFEIAQAFLALSLRRIEITEKLGIKQV